VASLEVLIVGSGLASDTSQMRIIAQSPPHVFVADVDVADLAAIAEIAPHAELVMTRTANGGLRLEGDQTALDFLDEGSRLFVEAWRTRPLTKPDRVGDKLAWDTPGFEPPDKSQ